MNIKTEIVTYGNDGGLFEGFLAWDEDIAGQRPGVLIAHTIRGRTEFEENKAIALAKMGYVGFALDVYGQSELGGTAESNRANMDALKSDRGELRRRLQLSLATMSGQALVDTGQQAAIGYCFGGLSVFDLARMGANIAGVVGFHGLFDAPDYTASDPVTAKVLALHGWDDPMATPEAVVAFGEEMTGLGVDWQVHAYGGTTHAFTYPPANDTAKGTVYNPVADRRSWRAMQDFLVELFK